MNGIKHVHVLAIMTIGLLMVGCSSEEETVVNEEVIRPVKLLTINAENTVNVRRFPAELKASEEADLAFRVGGQLAKLHITSGQRVKKGELLAELDPTDFELQVELAQANQNLASAQFKRIQTMLKQNATTQSQFDSSKANYDQANNALKQAKNQLKYTKLYAPFSGVISSLDTDNFQYVLATQSLMHIQNIDQLDADFQIPENLVVGIRSVTLDYQANVIIDSAQNLTLKGKYKEHKTTPDPNTKAYDVTLSLVHNPISNATLLPGMTADVELDLNKLLGARKHLVIPINAVQKYDNTTTQTSSSVVWVYDDVKGVVSPRSVELGILEGDQVEILSGLESGEQIVTVGVSSLTPSMKVRPWTREGGL